MSGSNTFVFSAKRRGSNTPVVCKFFSDQESYRREMKFFERVHTGDFVPGQSCCRLVPSHAAAMHTKRYCTCFSCMPNCKRYIKMFMCMKSLVSETLASRQACIPLDSKCQCHQTCFVIHGLGFTGASPCIPTELSPFADMPGVLWLGFY